MKKREDGSGVVDPLNPNLLDTGIAIIGSWLKLAIMIEYVPIVSQLRFVTFMGLKHLCHKILIKD